MGDQLVIAIDGPAAAGKSTVASAVAHRLGALYFDTGVIYRTVALAAVERNMDLTDGSALAALAQNLDIRVAGPSKADGRHYDVWLDERDVTWAIRSAEVDRAVSPVSAHPAVRQAVLAPQRRIGHSGRVVMVGRDVGTVVMPGADLKVWLDASLDERARRRQRELAARGVQRSFDEIRTGMADRDQRDASRVAAPMMPASDGIVIDTDGRTVDEVVDQIVALAVSRCRAKGDGRGA